MSTVRRSFAKFAIGVFLGATLAVSSPASVGSARPFAPEGSSAAECVAPFADAPGLISFAPVRGPLDWKTGDRAVYEISSGFAKGKAEQFVREESATALWTQTDVNMGFLGRQKIEIEYDRATGQIKTLWVNGRQQTPPDPTDMETIESRQERIRVPAGEFDSTFARMRSRKDGKVQEGWSNASAVPMGGMIKAKGEAPIVGAVTQELQSFAFAPR